MADKITIELGHGKKKKPGKNKDGQEKKPSANPDGEARPQLAPGVNVEGGVNPMTNPMKVSASAPIQGANPGGKPAGVITPTPTSDTRQVRQNINFKDMPPVGQQAVMAQQGVDLDAPRAALEQQAMGAVQGGPSQGPVPNALVGPMTPPGVESLPDDIGALSEMMRNGYAPGANPQEHALGQNAHAIARAQEAMQQSQSLQPAAPAPQLAPTGPPVAPGAPGGIPPELIAQLAEEAKRKKRPA